MKAMGNVQILCKLEYSHSSGSIKDRMAFRILDTAQRRGLLKSSTLVIEGSSGSTGISFAMACSQKGLRFRAVMPANVSRERIQLLEALNAEIHLVPDGGLAGVLEEVRRQGNLPDVYLPQQFSNIENANAHLATADEILGELPTVDYFVSAIGTGGTLAGVCRGLLRSGCAVVPVNARPVCVDSGTGRTRFCSGIPGIAEGFSRLFPAPDLPPARIIEVPHSEAMNTMRHLNNAGYMVGPSSGLNYAAALRLSIELVGPATIVTVFPDRVERYLSLGYFDKSLRVSQSQHSCPSV